LTVHQKNAKIAKTFQNQCFQFCDEHSKNILFASSQQDLEGREKTQQIGQQTRQIRLYIHDSHRWWSLLLLTDHLVFRGLSLGSLEGQVEGVKIGVFVSNYNLHRAGQDGLLCLGIVATSNASARAFPQILLGLEANPLLLEALPIRRELLKGTVPQITGRDVHKL
jgi:hypothetical protein